MIFLFFEPLTVEFVREVFRFLNLKKFISQLGGQTPINLSRELKKDNYEALGTSFKSMNLSEDRLEFSKLCSQNNLQVTKFAVATNYKEALEASSLICFPLICRPSYVIGGRRMSIIENTDELEAYFNKYQAFISKNHPCFMDQFLEKFLELDIDLVCGKDWALIGGVLEHIEFTGVHSGDSMAVLPPQRLKASTLKKIESLSLELVKKLQILGFLNLQIAVKDDEIYILEANPRSSRSVPFLAKATGIPIVDLGIEAILKKDKSQIDFKKWDWKQVKNTYVKGVLFPFDKFEDVDSILGPEMKSIGEVMGCGSSYAEALMKSLAALQIDIPLKGDIFFSLRDKDKKELLDVAREFLDLGYTLSATHGTASFFQDNGLSCTFVKKVLQGRPHSVDRISSGQVAFIVNTTSGRQSIQDSFSIRRAAIDKKIPCLTQAETAKAFLLALKKRKALSFEVFNL